MNGNQLVVKLDSLLQWIVRLVVLNVLWIVFSILGLFVAGVFPASAAVFGIARKWVMGEQEIKLWTTFKQIYRREFATANLMGWILTILGIILYLNYRVILKSSGEMTFVVPFAFYFLVFFYSILVIWTFPLLVHYKATWRQHFRNAIIIGLTKIHYTIVCGAVVFASLYFSFSYPGIIPFFTISSIGIGCMWFTLKVFNNMDEGKDQPKSEISM
jgi:uncharacterized membrane protein YesL